MLGAALLSAIHLLGLAVGVGAIFARTRAFRRLATNPGALSDVFFADNLWGLSAVLSIGTGVLRAFTSVEKGSGYYLNNGAFLLKLGLVGLVLALELWPMITLIRWRIAQGRRAPFDVSNASRFATISAVQVALMITIPFFASMMARGIGFTWFAG